MYLFKIILGIVCVGLFPGVFGQTARYDGDHNLINLQDAKGVRVVEEVRFAKGQNDERVNYDRIKGSPFWKDASQPARLYSSTGYMGTVPVRINLATGELYFLRDSEEVILTDNIIVKVVFKAEKDSSVFISQIPNLWLNNKPVDGFVQVLNFGKYQLLKYTNRTVASVDSIVRGFKRYYFADIINYFIKSNDKVERIKKLNKENVLFNLPSSSSYDAWIKENNIDFKKEKDVVRFINFYNSHLSDLISQF